MENEIIIFGLSELGNFLNKLLNNENTCLERDVEEFELVLRDSEIENSWFTKENLFLCLQKWATILNENNIKNWLKNYEINKNPKKVGLILAGNIPMVGFHDVVSVILSHHTPLIKFSSKDRLLIPYLLKKWNEFSENAISYEFVEKLTDFDAVIATGSNNTAQYLAYYFKNKPSIIRKNRTSVAVLNGDETKAQLELLSDDIFIYFGLGCRNVTRIFIPQDFKLDLLFESYLKYKELINHHKYANNYDYHKAIYLLNQDLFWDNDFVMMMENDQLFSALSVINFSRYSSIEEVKLFLNENAESIQAIVANPNLDLDSIDFGTAQDPSISTYADHIDTMDFLSKL